MDQEELASDLYGDPWFEFYCGAPLHPRFMELHRFLRGEPEELTEETMVLRDFIARYFLGLPVEDPDSGLHAWLQYDFVNNGMLDPQIYAIQEMKGMPENAAALNRTRGGGRTPEAVDRDMDAVLADGPWADPASPAEQAGRRRNELTRTVPVRFERNDPEPA